MQVVFVSSEPRVELYGIERLQFLGPFSACLHNLLVQGVASNEYRVCPISSCTMVSVGAVHTRSLGGSSHIPHRRWILQSRLPDITALSQPFTWCLYVKGKAPRLRDRGKCMDAGLFGVQQPVVLHNYTLISHSQPQQVAVSDSFDTFMTDTSTRRVAGRVHIRRETASAIPSGATGSISAVPGSRTKLLRSQPLPLHSVSARQARTAVVDHSTEN